MKKSTKKNSSSITAFFARNRALVYLALLGIALPFLMVVIVQKQTYKQHAAVNHQVTIQNYTMSPTSLTVSVGDTVTWTNQDSDDHDTHSTTEVWDSPDLAQGQSFSFTFTQPGTFEYYCTPHKGMMKGYTIVVVPAVSQAPVTTLSPLPSSGVITPPFGCLGCTPSPSISPVQPTITNTPGNPSVVPSVHHVPSVSVVPSIVPPAPGGNGQAPQGLIALILAFLLAILQFMQSLFGGGA